MLDDTLEPEALLQAYCHGAFPMGDPGMGEVSFYTCDPRAVLPVESFRTPRDARRKLSRGEFTVTVDQEFEAVMRACAVDRTPSNPSWITEAMIECFTRLHDRGHAHSVECWREQRMVGGLYGVSIGAAFFGESMFSRPDLGGSDASSAALGELMRRLRERGFTLFDCQYINDHTRRLGAVEIPLSDYLTRLEAAVAVADRW